MWKALVDWFDFVFKWAGLIFTVGMLILTMYGGGMILLYIILCLLGQI